MMVTQNNNVTLTSACINSKIEKIIAAIMHREILSFTSKYCKHTISIEYYNKISPIFIYIYIV